MQANYCLFHKANLLHYGVILGSAKTKLIIQPQLGREFHVNPNQLFHTWLAEGFATAEEGLGILTARISHIEAQQAGLDLKTLHELLEPGQAFSLAELAELVLPEPHNPWSQVALLLALREESLLFHCKNGVYQPRNEEEMQLLLAERHKEEEKRGKKDREAVWAKALLEKTSPEVGSFGEHWNGFLHRCKNFLLHLNTSQERDWFSEIFALDLGHPRSAENKLLAALAATPVALSWGRLQLERVIKNLEFSSAELQAAREVAASNAPHPSGLPVKDLTGLAAFSVDNEETQDYDDALAWHGEDEGTRVWLLIADVAARITADSPLLDTALTRQASIYSPLAVYPMLPPALSVEACSLVAGAVRPAMCFEVLLAAGQVREWSCYPAAVQVRANLTYAQVDEALSRGDEAWCALQQALAGLTAQRLAAGALQLSRREIRLDLADRNAVRIAGYREDTPSSLLIQESAILVNHLAARYCQEQAVAALFRNQPPYEVVNELTPGQAPRLQDLRIQPARLGLKAEGHAALGLPCYLQITSPIRRASDLVNQHLLWARLGGQPLPFGEERLLGLIPNFEDTAKEYNQLERSLSDHWKYKYLAQNGEQDYAIEPLRRLRNGRLLVRIKDLELTLDMGCPEGMEPQWVKVREVFPHEDYALLTPLHPRETVQDAHQNPLQHLQGENRHQGAEVNAPEAGQEPLDGEQNGISDPR